MSGLIKHYTRFGLEDLLMLESAIDAIMRLACRNNDEEILSYWGEHLFIVMDIIGYLTWTMGVDDE